jgi:hypothetical protein
MPRRTTRSEPDSASGRRRRWVWIRPGEPPPRPPDANRARNRAAPYPHAPAGDENSSPRVRNVRVDSSADVVT